LSKFGALVRQRSRRSIRKRKQASKPGSPPTNRTGVLKRYIYFGYDSNRRSVVIGPVIAPGKAGKAPETLEYGGNTRRRWNPRRVSRSIGDGGIVSICGLTGPATGQTAKDVIDSKGKKRRVAFARLTTDKLVEHAEKMETIIYGPMMLPSSNIEARPFMGPAFEAELPKVASLWANSIK